MLLADVGEKLGVDLWHYETSDGRSIRKALEFLAPFATAEKKWTYQQLGDWPPQMLFPLIRRASAHYQDAHLRALLSEIPAAAADDRTSLWP